MVCRHGVQKAVVTLASEPIQKVSRWWGLRARAATAPRLAQPASAMGKGRNQPVSGFQKVVVTFPSAPIQ